MSKTDKELFREYLNSKIEGREDTVGVTYFAKDGYEFYDLDRLLINIADAIVTYDPEPLAELDHAIGTFGNVLDDLERVRAGFIAYKAAQEAV
ncbi:hypothetical protein [Brucella anthropi]|uniref:hypothetical protein n=1 Tax=Brucella anthropi TaxID=529 RepID=UPI0005B9CC18|nr:hypothetical protein [Brucella anthropi]KIU68524.1 hypothetical protein TR92_11795 [Brucella anthropi]